MILELRDKLEGMAERPPPYAGSLASRADEIEQDVLSALVNLAVHRPAAEAAIRKAKSAGGAARRSSNRCSAALWSWYGKLKLHARIRHRFRVAAGRRTAV